MPKNETKLQRAKRKKRELEEDLDYLKEVEKPGGREFVVDKLKEDEKAEEVAEDQIKNYLETSTSAKYTYRRKLAEYALTKMDEVSYPEGWEFYALPTDGTRIKIFTKWFKSQEGILLILKDEQGNVYTRGIKTTQKPEYDVKAINILVVQVENTVDSKKGILLSDKKNGDSKFKKTKSGIYLNE